MLVNHERVRYRVDGETAVLPVRSSRSNMFNLELAATSPNTVLRCAMLFHGPRFIGEFARVAGEAQRASLPVFATVWSRLRRLQEVAGNLEIRCECDGPPPHALVLSFDHLPPSADAADEPGGGAASMVMGGLVEVLQSPSQPGRINVVTRPPAQVTPETMQPFLEVVYATGRVPDGAHAPAPIASSFVCASPARTAHLLEQIVRFETAELIASLAGMGALNMSERFGTPPDVVSFRDWLARHRAPVAAAVAAALTAPRPPRPLEGAPEGPPTSGSTAEPPTWPASGPGSSRS